MKTTATPPSSSSSAQRTSKPSKDPTFTRFFLAGLRPNPSRRNPDLRPPAMDSVEAVIAHIQALSANPDEISHLHSLLKQSEDSLRSQSSALHQHLEQAPPPLSSSAALIPSDFTATTTPSRASTPRSRALRRRATAPGPGEATTVRQRRSSRPPPRATSSTFQMPPRRRTHSGRNPQPALGQKPRHLHCLRAMPARGTTAAPPEAPAACLSRYACWS